MLHPLTNNILIRPEKAPDKTESGLHLVDHWASENMGEVVALPERVDAYCPDCGTRVFAAPSVKVGDTVIFPLEAGQELTVNGERFLLMKDADLLAVVEPSEVMHG
jgi:chaperonin GroES